MFFFQFLDAGDRWKEFLSDGPLDYIGNRGSGKLTVMGTALKRMDEVQSLCWVQSHILASISPALSLPGILDIDTMVKCLYGHQKGTQRGYNPSKPGRPCHVYHSYFVAILRISLGVEVHPGKEHAAPHGISGFWSMLEGLPRDRWPTFVRGDCGYGREVGAFSGDRSFEVPSPNLSPHHAKN